MANISWYDPVDKKPAVHFLMRKGNAAFIEYSPIT